MIRQRDKLQLYFLRNMEEIYEDVWQNRENVLENRVKLRDINYSTKTNNSSSIIERHLITGPLVTIIARE